MQKTNRPSRGQVQMIYFDPPYGINYSSNFQPFFGKKKNEESNLNDANQKVENLIEPLTVFRDTWEHGIHSYLDTIRKRLIAAREILADTGSIFVQISVDNVHRVRLLLDEEFGAENFMWEILFQTAGGGGHGTYPTTYDYILWYAKDKQVLKTSNKLHQIYLNRNEEHLKDYNRIYMPNGNLIPVPKDGKIPKNSHRCLLQSPYSKGYSTSGRSKPHKFPNGIVISPGPTRQWRVGPQSLNNLYNKKRLYFSKNRVYIIAYPEDSPRTLTNIWSGMLILIEKNL